FENISWGHFLPHLSVQCCLPVGPVTFHHQLARIDHLDNVDKLLESHDRGRDTVVHQRSEAVNLISSGHFQGTSTPWTGEETAWSSMGRVSRLCRGRLGLRERLQERWGKGRRRERE